MYSLGTNSPGSLSGKESACNAGDLGLTPGLGRSLRGGHGNSLQCSCLENPHGQRSMVGYSPWGCKELDMTERLSTAAPTRTIFLFQVKISVHIRSLKKQCSTELEFPSFKIVPKYFMLIILKEVFVYIQTLSKEFSAFIK